MESEEKRIKNAAHLMVASLAGSLAHVTCKVMHGNMPINLSFLKKKIIWASSIRMTHFIGSLLAFIFYFNLFLPGTVTDINIKSAEDCTSEFRYCK